MKSINKTKQSTNHQSKKQDKILQFHSKSNHNFTLVLLITCNFTGTGIQTTHKIAIEHITEQQFIQNTLFTNKTTNITDKNPHRQFSTTRHPDKKRKIVKKHISKPVIFGIFGAFFALFCQKLTLIFQKTSHKLH